MTSSKHILSGGTFSLSLPFDIEKDDLPAFRQLFHLLGDVLPELSAWDKIHCSYNEKWKIKITRNIEKEEVLR
jgi:hypothetical protein